jgi:hypothetical protein
VFCCFVLLVFVNVKKVRKKEFCWKRFHCFLVLFSDRRGRDLTSATWRLISKETTTQVLSANSFTFWLASSFCTNLVQPPYHDRLLRDLFWHSVLLNCIHTFGICTNVCTHTVLLELGCFVVFKHRIDVSWQTWLQSPPNFKALLRARLRSLCAVVEWSLMSNSPLVQW